MTRWLLALTVATLACIALAGRQQGPALANHNVPDCALDINPDPNVFEYIQAYERRDYPHGYAPVFELAGFNQLFPDVPGFALPPLETGPRSAGSSRTVSPYIPPTILKAIGWIESGWAQASYHPLVNPGEVGPALVSFDCGYGIMQVTTGMQPPPGSPPRSAPPTIEQAMIGGHYAFNIARGALILAQKWNLAPEFNPIVGERDPRVVENWYFAIWSYNGFAFVNHPRNPDFPFPRPPYKGCDPNPDGAADNRGNYPYQELVYGCMAYPPVWGGRPLWNPLQAALPDYTQPAFTDTTRFFNCARGLGCAGMDIATPTLTPSATATPTVTPSPTPTPSPTATPTPSPTASPTSGAGSSGSGSSSQIQAVATTGAIDPTFPQTNRTALLGSPSPTASPASVTLALAPEAQSDWVNITVSNPGTGVFAWYATSDVPWLQVSRLEGVSLGSELGPRASSLAVRASSFGLGPGTYTGRVTLRSLYGSSVEVTVTLAVVQGVPTGTWSSADFSGDAKGDLALASTNNVMFTWLSLGNGSFDQRTQAANYALAQGTWLPGDFNGDGKRDLLHIAPDRAVTWFSWGNGTYLPWPANIVPGQGTWLAGDFNHDRITDVIYIGSDRAVTWFNWGNGTYLGWPANPVPPRGGTWVAGDFNGDGLTDLANIGPSRVTLWLNWGDGNYLVWPASLTPPSGGPWVVGDFDGNKLTDLFVVTGTNTVQTWLDRGNGDFRAVAFRANYDISRGTWLPGDFNGDGKTDLLHLAPDRSVTWFSWGDGTYLPWTANIPVMQATWLVGDFDGDGKSDVAGITAARINVWLSRGDGSYVQR